MKMKDQISEREYQGRLESLLKSAFNTELQPLRSLETATKKRRALEKKGRKKFWVHETKHDGFRLMVCPARAFCEMMGASVQRHSH
jgi:ATP-dependent DNA ligase